MGRHIATYVHPLLAPISLGISEGLIEGAVIEVVLEFIGEIGVLGTLVLRSPGKAVVVLPLALEGLAVASPCPELRFLEEDGIDAFVYHGLDVAFLEISEVVLRGYNIRDESSVPDGVALHRLLPFVEVPLAVPFACEIVLIVAPGNACHEVRGITSLPPRLYTLAKGHTSVVVGSIDHHKVGANVCDWFPGSCSLECCLLGCFSTEARPKVAEFLCLCRSRQSKEEQKKRCRYFHTFPSILSYFGRQRYKNICKLAKKRSFIYSSSKAVER